MIMHMLVLFNAPVTIPSAILLDARLHPSHPSNFSQIFASKGGMDKCEFFNFVFNRFRFSFFFLVNEEMTRL